MKRRAFLAAIAGGAAATSFGAYLFMGKEEAYIPEPPAPLQKNLTKVHLAGVKGGASDEEIREAVRETVMATEDLSWLSRGETVFIKPALNSGNPYPSTTHSAALAAMVELLRERGAKRVLVGDMSGIEHVKLSPKGVTGSSRALMAESGILRAIEKAGGEGHFFEESGWEGFYPESPGEGSHWINKLMMPNILKEVDHIILMPRCARHALAGATLGLKAAVGYWRTDTRVEYHRDASTFHEKTAEGNTVPTLLKKQRLVVSAADRILTTFGPDKGYVSTPVTGLVMSTDSVVAHDMISLAWLLINRELTPMSKKEGIEDPYQNQFIVNAVNHLVTAKLGGFRPMIASEKLKRHDIDAIWDDRVLHRAFEIFKGTPNLEFATANDSLPDALLQQLKKMTAYPGTTI